MAEGGEIGFGVLFKKEVVEVAEETAESEVEKKSVIETVEAIHRVDPAKQDIKGAAHAVS